MSWKCPRCGRMFRCADQYHSCQVMAPELHFENRPEILYITFLQLVKAVQSFGEVSIEATPSAITFRAGAGFLTIRVKKDRLDTELYLARIVESEIITGHFRVSANRILHRLTLCSPDDISGELIPLLRESYLLISGAQTENKSGS